MLCNTSERETPGPGALGPGVGARGLKLRAGARGWGWGAGARARGAGARAPGLHGACMGTVAWAPGPEAWGPGAGANWHAALSHPCKGATKKRKYLVPKKRKHLTNLFKGLRGSCVMFFIIQVSAAQPHRLFCMVAMRIQNLRKS